MHRNYTRTGFEVCACTASLPQLRMKNLFHKLIRVITIFMRNIFVVQCHPQYIYIFNIELFLNYGMNIIIEEMEALRSHTLSPFSS